MGADSAVSRAPEISASLHTPGFIGKTLALARKDFRVELRARDTLPPMLAFVVAVTLLLAFSIPSSGSVERAIRIPTGAVALADVLAGFLWVTVLFAGLIAFARTFEVERNDAAIDSLLLVPLDRSGLFLAKALANFAFIVLAEVLLIPMFLLLFGTQVGGSWPALILVVLLADFGFVAVGTLFAAISAQTRSRELLLPVLALPALVPVFIAAVALTFDLFAGAGFDEVASRGWFVLLGGFDIIFGVVGALAFDVVVD